MDSVAKKEIEVHSFFYHHLLFFLVYLGPAVKFNDSSGIAMVGHNIDTAAQSFHLQSIIRNSLVVALLASSSH